MTGYGKAEYISNGHKTIVEIRSVNSKQLDLSLKIGSYFREKEPAIRAILQRPLERGKVDVSVYTQPLDNTQDAEKERNITPINWEAVRFYMDDYKANVSELQLPMTMGNHIPVEIMASIMRYPDVLKRQAETQETISDEEWSLLEQTIQTALTNYIAFRRQEGESLSNMFEQKLTGIMDLLGEVEPLEQHRIDNIKARLIDNLQKIGGEGGSINGEKVNIAYDKNRLEAEMIYYLEKLDITEEKVRLRNHIRYFRETMSIENAAAGETGVGKKLGFIAQEMGREINTLGSKSNQSEMQVIVVKMKDLLEQIKEQVLNVL